MSKGLDQSFLQYGIRKKDLQLISELCVSHQLDEDWLMEQVLKQFHNEKVDKIELDATAIQRIMTKALQKLPKQ